MKKIIPLFLLLFINGMLKSQRPVVEVLESGTKTSLRGLSVVNDNILWVCGSNGTVGKSNNAGKNFKWLTVKGFEKTEFRDIEAFDANTALIMSVAEPAYILKTTDGGDSWKVVYENKTPGMFLDAMDFSNNQKGLVIGDPIGGRVFMAKTSDSGNNWDELSADDNRLKPDSGEAFFASSGTNVKLFSNGDYFLVSGGMRSRFITRDAATDLPLVQGKESTGANSIDIFDEGVPDKPGDKIIVVGGDFMADSARKGNCFYSNNRGKTWQEPVIPPHGYRSCVEYIGKKAALTCGLNGVDYSIDGGRTWKWISKEGFHVCRIAKTGNAVYFAGGNGKVGKLFWR